MGKYRITDNQSGKTLVISGNTPPTEQEAEQLFQQSGVRGATPSAQVAPQVSQPVPQPPKQTDAFSNPILNSLLHNAGNVAKDVGAGMVNVLHPDYQKSQNSALQGAYDLMSRAQTTKDQTEKQRLMKLAQQITATVSQNSQQEQSNYSPQVQEGVVGRAIKAGGEVATTAEIPSLLKGGVNLVKGAVNLVKGGGPIKAIAVARDVAAQQAGQNLASGSKIAAAGEKYLANDPLAKTYAEKVGTNIVDKAIPADELLEKLKIWNTSITAAGKVGKSSKAGYYNALARAGKEEMKRIAPEVSKLTGQLSFLYNAPKTVRKVLVSLGATAGGIAAMKYLLGGGKSGQ